MVFGAQNSEEIWSRQFCFYPPHLFSAISCLQYSILIFWQLKIFYCGSPTNYRVIRYNAPKPMKQENWWKGGVVETRCACRVACRLTVGWCFRCWSDDDDIVLVSCSSPNPPVLCSLMPRTSPISNYLRFDAAHAWQIFPPSFIRWRYQYIIPAAFSALRVFSHSRYHQLIISRLLVRILTNFAYHFFSFWFRAVD